MTQYNTRNERIKHQYFAYLKEARQQSEATIDAVAEALDRFEAYTRRRDFKAFHIEQASGFKSRLADMRAREGERPLSKATLYGILANLKRFFQWLSMQPGYKAAVKFTDAEYFNLARKDVRIATAKRERPVPSLADVQRAIRAMPSTVEVERRDRALVCFILLTGARDAAVISLKLKHVDVEALCVHQDGREVKTKFSKTFTSYFFPVGHDILQILVDWVTSLREIRQWSDDDPLFPKTATDLGPDGQFRVAGIARGHWHTTTPVRSIFKEAFARVGLPYFHPHSIRSTLVQFAETACRNPEEFKAVSQNLGHDQVLTTFSSYGAVSTRRQGDIVRALGASPQACEDLSDQELLSRMAARLGLGVGPRP